jgi:hypothetical protein
MRVLPAAVLVLASLLLGNCSSQEQDAAGASLLTVVPIREQHVAGTAEAFAKRLQASCDDSALERELRIGVQQGMVNAKTKLTLACLVQDWSCEVLRAGGPGCAVPGVADAYNAVMTGAARCQQPAAAKLRFGGRVHS